MPVTLLIPAIIQLASHMRCKVLELQLMFTTQKGKNMISKIFAVLNVTKSGCSGLLSFLDWATASLYWQVYQTGHVVLCALRCSSAHC